MHRVWRAAFAASAMSVTGPAWAQTVEASDRPVQLAMADAEQPGTIVVTGQPLIDPAVARTGSLGLLGDRDFIETPFSVTSYTYELVKNLGARTLVEVLESSPAVTRTGGRFDTDDEFSIRGFPISSDDSSYDGLYGLASYRTNQIAAIERIDLLRGPNALLNGVPPSGGIGGSLNYVPKRAGAQPLTEAELDYLTGGNVGGAIDIARRFGTGDAFGARVNLAYRDGNVALRGANERQGSASAGLDWRSHRARLFVDLSYDDVRNAGAVFAPFTLAEGLPVPKAPDNATNPAAPFTFTHSHHVLGLIRGEYDVAKGWTVSIGYGRTHLSERQLVDDDGPLIADAAGTVLDSDLYRSTAYVREDRQTVDAKLHGQFATGPVTHDLAIGGYWLHGRFDSAEADVPGIGSPSNLYAYQPAAAPPSFAGAEVDPYLSHQTLSGAAISDTASAFDGRVQLTAGVRRQRIASDSAYNGGGGSYARSAWTPAFALLLRPMHWLSLYGNYVQALSQAPSAPDNAINRFEVFPPARSRQKEVGAKLDLKTFGATLAFFDITEPSGVLGVDDVFRVNGRERHRGVELETFGTVLPRLRVLGGASYLDAKLVKTDGGEFDGRDAVNVPNWIVSAGLEWDTPVPRLTLSGRLVHNGRRFIDQANTQRIPAWNRLDLGARYVLPVAGRTLTVRANVTNALGNDYFESGNGNLVLGPPRYTSLSAAVSF